MVALIVYRLKRAQMRTLFSGHICAQTALYNGRHQSLLKGNGMRNELEAESERVRLLECWLPLAQAIGTACGWDKRALSLEELVVTASAALAKSHSTENAAQILTHFYEINQGYES